VLRAGDWEAEAVRGKRVVYIATTLAFMREHWWAAARATVKVKVKDEGEREG
jgi:hypothetical protein